MRAIVVRPGATDSARLVERPAPEPGPDRYRIRVLEVGIDGTDREIDAGLYGEPVAGGDELVLGHEAVGEVVEACPGDASLREGDTIVPTVRRPDPRRCPNCRVGEYDACLNRDYRERGIKGEHGYLAEFFVERPEFLVRVPDELRDVAVLLEPLSVVEKAFRQIDAIQRRMRWEPRLAFVVGAGNVGMLAAILARLRGVATLVYSRGRPAGARAAVLDRLDADYADSERVPLAAVAEEVGSPDIAFEATGRSAFSWEAAEVIRANGTACLLSVPGGDADATIASDRLTRGLVLGNRIVFGSVSSHRIDFERGVADLLAIRELWPGLLERLIIRRVPMSRIREALAPRERGELKTVIEVAPA